MLPIKIISKLCRLGKFGQWIAVILVSMCAMSCALGFAWTSGAFPKIRRGEAGFTLDLNEQSWVASILFFGNIFSPIPSGYLMEHFGRRNSLCLTIWLQVIAFVIIGTTKSFWAICVARILKGFWVGAVYTIVPVYIAECVDPKIRGVLGTFYGVFLYIGSLIVSTVGSLFSYWTLAWVSCLFTLSLAILLCFIPESPYFYLMKGDEVAARSSMTWLRGYCNETVLQTIVDSIEKSKNTKSTYADVFKRPSARKGFIISALLGSIQRSSGLAILLTYTSVTMPDYIVTADVFGIILNGVWTVACLVSGFVMDRFGRRTMMGFSCAGSSLTMLGVSIWFFLRDKTTIDVSSVTWLPFVLLMIHGFSYSFGIVSIPTMIPGEIFSPDIKSKATALVSVWVALVSGVVLNVYLPLEASVGRYSNFLICSISSFIGIMTSIFVMIETKGRSIEDIIDELENNKPEKKMVESTKF